MTNFHQPHVQTLREISVPFSRKKLSVGIASVVMATASLAMVSPASVFAQEAPSANGNQNELSQEIIEEIVVSGIRFSQRSALDRKRESGTMSDSLVAEDIGEFPDKNIGEALQRIPGIQLDRDNGEGATVSIRGVSPDLLRVEVNGVGAMGMGGSRAVDFRDMASELVRSLDVIKGSEARLTEGGIGGTIHVNTRKPNEFDSNFLSVSGEGQYNDLIGDIMPKFNVTGVYKFNEDFGVLLNVTASDKNTIIHALRNTEWARFADYDNSPEKTTVHPDYAGVTDKADCASAASVEDCESQWLDFSPFLPRYGMWRRDEKRLSANAMAQYRFNDYFSSHVSYTVNHRDKAAHDINLQFETQSAARIDPDSVVVRPNKNVASFETAQASVSNRVLQFAWDQKTTMLETGFEFENDQWKATGQLARSESEQDIDSRDTTAWADGIAGIRVDLNEKGLPDINLSNAYIRNPDDLSDTSNTFDVNDPGSYAGGSRFRYTPSRDETSEDMAKFDLVFSPEDGFFTSFMTGFQHRTESFANWSFRHDISRNVGATYNDEEWTIEDQTALIQGRTQETDPFFKGYSLGVNTLGTWQAIDNHAFMQAMREVSADSTERRDLDVQRGNFDVEVASNAIYGQANFETELGGLRLNGNFGVRIVETDTKANGDVTIRVIEDQLDEDGEPIVNDAGIYLSEESLDDDDIFDGRKTISSSYSDVLPSLNLNLHLIQDELILYFGAAKVMSRPRIGDINVNANCTLYKNTQAEIDNEANVCTAGNPNLDPYRATQMDLALTWYPNQDSIVSGALFTKDITSWIIDPETNYDVDFFNDGRVWDVRQRLNGSGVKVKGLELQASTMFTMLPAPFDGFGGSVNYTYMEADDVGLFNALTGEELPFPNQSKNSYNVTAFYEANSWSARVAYNYRDEYLVAARDRSGNPAFVDSAGYLDAKFNYNITPQLRFHVDGRNLTGEVRSINAGPGRMSTYDWAGREYSVGLTYRM
ncbi:TonB-dependent receptor [Marinimicrobium alkaliphilum]|uniref:TonB-dependent receptor n=1 Tax=Marinimicrobium alkaliphilum TaxID=2202654 RepID=UPI000DBAC1B6|nr:TonB-dependent receptor [Marinimicrobium alkaliphilum]